uniref:Polymerase PA n=1 Tax=Hubei earwig virus 1 TaxID=1922890 RepID=A0A1L3KKI6_9VIRU|nr:polymerase PA [Hubei earwig virus 1]
MSENYQKLIYNYGLYDRSFVENFGENSKYWHREGWKSREMSLRHDMCCILLCNLETLNFHEMITHFKKRKGENLINEITKKHRADIGIQTVVQSTSSSGESHSSGASSAETMERYRLILIEGMPTPELIQNEYSRIYNIEPPSDVWDIFDQHAKQFIEVKVTTNINYALDKYNTMKATYNHGALCIINPYDGSIRWLDHDGNLNGETKVMNFILGRANILKELNILESDLTEEVDLESSILCSDWLNSMIREWDKTMDVDKESTPVHESLDNDSVSPISDISPSALLEGLSDLKENDREQYIKWRGKISPNFLTTNLIVRSSDDFNIVKEIFCFIESLKLEYFYDWSNLYCPGFLKDLGEALMDKKSTNFSLMLNKRSRKEFEQLLGVGRKKVKFEDGNMSTTEKEHKPIKRLKYHSYFDNILRNMSHSPKNDGFKPLRFLEMDIPESVHPISKIVNPLTRQLLDELSETDCAYLATKISGLYSRLGGSYLQNPNSNKTNHSNIAIIPIYSTSYNSMNEIRRRASGLCIRGPHHARSPTDRINIFVIEIFPNNDDVKTFLSFQKPISIWFNDRYIITGKQNSIMKDDPTYLTYIHSSLFVPFNTIGVMTLENPIVQPDINMLTFGQNLIRENKGWIKERYVENTVYAIVGNARDEGYFSLLRKLYMVILSWRRRKLCGHMNVQGLCEKMNECLIDNPVSMHFHNTLLKIIMHYQSIEDQIS